MDKDGKYGTEWEISDNEGKYGTTWGNIGYRGEIFDRNGNILDRDGKYETVVEKKGRRVENNK